MCQDKLKNVIKKDSFTFWEKPIHIHPNNELNVL